MLKATLSRSLSVLGCYAGVLVLAAAASAQIQVRYGDPAHAGSIRAPGEVHRFLLMGARQDDVLRLTFCSQNSGRPYYTYYHQLQVLDGATPVGPLVKGRGALTVKLPRTAVYSIEVRAQNGRSTGWYGLKLDRLNGPVGAQRVALGWTMQGDVRRTTDFAVYTFRAEAGRDGKLHLASRDSGRPYYTPYHYAEILESATGKQVVGVTGNAAPKSFQFPVTGTYVVFVAARNYESTGWFSATASCESWPGSPCDTVAHVSGFGRGSRGTLGVPSFGAAAPPKTGAALDLRLGNSYGKPTSAWVMLGTQPAGLRLAAHDATLYVGRPVFLRVPLSSGGGATRLPIPPDPLLHGLGFAMQSVVADPGAKGGLAFSRGLVVIPGK